MSSVVLVGNGTSIRDRELGEVIDSYDTVVRFNYYDTKGQEKYIGSKTDYWFTSVYELSRAKRAFENDIGIITHNYVWHNRHCKLFHAFKKHINERCDPKKQYKIGSTFEKLVYDLLGYGYKKSGMRKKITNPSAGEYMFSSYGMAAWWFAMEKKNQYKKEMKFRTGKTLDLPECDRVDIYGFDWWQWGSESWTLDDSPATLKNYNATAEKALFSFLHGDKKIKDLHPDSDFHKYYE